MREYSELDGYRYDFEYSSEYQRDLAPVWLRLLLESRSFAFPSVRPLRYLELGYGMGVSLNVHAAADPGDYWGTDISPAHHAAAKKLAGASRARIDLLDLPFASLLESVTLPLFDVIVAHGIWSWVSPANREVIVEIAKRHLAEGGVFLLNYVALPAEADIVPLHRLLRSQNYRDPRDALNLAVALREAGSFILAGEGRAAQRLEALLRTPGGSIEHDYLSAYREPFLFCEVAAAFSAAGLRYAGGGRLLDKFDEVNFDARQCALLASIEDPAMRETARDYLRRRPRRQRYDAFVKQPAQMTDRGIPGSREFVLLAPPAAARHQKIRTGYTDIALDDADCRAVIDRLAADEYRPKRLDELPGGGKTLRSLFALLDFGLAAPVLETPAAPEAVETCARLNAEILDRARTDDAIDVLASPVSGCGVPLSRSERLFLLAVREGARTPEQWAAFARPHVKAPSVDNLRMEAAYFQARLPCLRGLGLLPD